MEKELEAIERKLASLSDIGVRADPVRAALALARSYLKKKQPEKARKKIDETLVLFKIAASEIEQVIARLSSDSPGQDVQSKNRTPTLDEISDTVEEAFKRHLHSSALRRMVEVIALEKVRSILQDEAIPQSWLDRVVKQTLNALKSDRKQLR